MICNRAYQPNSYRYPEYYYHNAREALHDFVRVLVNVYGVKKIYMPGYIGWSPKEGSGLFDSVKDINHITIHYYKMDSTLSVDMDSFTALLEGNTCRSIVLLVNYFGFRDIEYESIVHIAHSNGNVVIEDNAHGFFTYYLDRRTDVDATFFSLHKQFPFMNGGVLKIHNPDFFSLDFFGSKILSDAFNPYVYDIESIGNRRISNYLQLNQLIESRANEIDYIPLFSVERLVNVVPQSFPVLITNADRNYIYHKLNEAGYGVVSLYHTLINDLDKDEFVAAQEISKRILNLPVHQDVDPTQYILLIEELDKLCSEYR